MMRTLTGSSGGETPITDSNIRGGASAAALGLIAFLGQKFGVLTVEDIGAIAIFLPWFVLAAFGVWDRLSKKGAQGG